MKTEETSGFRQKFRKIGSRVLKATIKVVIVVVIYIFLSAILAPVYAMVPGLQGMISTFVIVYVALMAVGDLTAGTILQHLFNGARALYIITYLIFSLNRGILEYTFESVNLMIDIRLFLVVVMLLELLALAKCIMQTIGYLNERIEIAMI